MKENYVFPAIFEDDGDQVTITFPTLENAVTCAERDGHELEAAQELLALTLIDLEDSGRPIPECLYEAVDPGEGKLVYVHVWLPYFRSKTREVYVKKTLTIPAWLDLLAKQNNINFSETLTEALRKKLQLD